MKALNAIKRLEKAGYVCISGEILENTSQNVEFKKKGEIIGFTKTRENTVSHSRFWVDSDTSCSPTFGFTLKNALSD